MKIYDVAFLGLGASGLATLRLNFKNTSMSIIGIDKNYNSPRNNFFAFWLTDWMKEFDVIIKYCWHRWKFHYDGIEVLHESNKMPYCVIRFQEWKKFCIEGFDNLKIKEKDAVNLIKINDYFEITLEDGEKIYSKKIYDSRTPDQQKNKLKQHFLGLVIKSNEIVYEDIVNLMDFRVNQENGLHFMYVLPLKSNEILIESTVFSNTILESDWYKTKIKDYIQNNLKIKNYEILEEEKGILPMHSIQYPKIADGHINIGSRGGATKISSGYAFSFFLKKLKSSQLEKNKHHSFWDIWMDRIFVDYLENNKKTHNIFKKMVMSLNGDEFASFMMGTAKFGTKLKIIYSMPKIGFIKSFFRSLST